MQTKNRTNIDERKDRRRPLPLLGFDELQEKARPCSLRIQRRRLLRLNILKSSRAPFAGRGLGVPRLYLERVRNVIRNIYILICQRRTI